MMPLTANCYKNAQPKFHCWFRMPWHVALAFLLLFSQCWCAFSFSPMSLQSKLISESSTTVLHVDRSRRGRKLGGGAMKKLHKEVVGRAADQAAKKKVVVEQLTEEEEVIVERLKIERAKAEKTDNAAKKEKDGDE